MGNTQTGVTSALGLAVESLFRTPPLTLIAGSVYSLGIAGTNPLRYTIIEPCTGVEGSAEVDVKDEVDGSVERRRFTQTGAIYQGDVAQAIDPEGLYYLLLGALGRDVQTSPHVGVYQHAMTPALHAPSFSCEEDLGDHTTGRLSSGVVVSRLDLEFGDILTAKSTLYAHRQIPNSYPNAAGVKTQYGFGSTPSLLPSQMGGDGTKLIQATAAPIYVDVAAGANGDGPLPFASMTYGTQANFADVFLLINGAPVQVLILSGSSVSIDRKVDSRQVGGSGFDRGSVTGNKVNVSGKLMLQFLDMSIDAANLDFSQLALDLMFVGPPIGATGYNESLEMHLPHVKITKSPIGPSDKTLIYRCDFQARMDDTYGYSLKVILTNTFSNATLGGQYVPPCTVTTAIPNNTTDIAVVNTTAGLIVGNTYTLQGATSAYNPCTVTSITDATHVVLTGATAQATIQGNIAVGASLVATSGIYGPSGLGGWVSS